MAQGFGIGLVYSRIVWTDGCVPALGTSLNSRILFLHIIRIAANVDVHIYIYTCITHVHGFLVAAKQMLKSISHLYIVLVGFVLLLRHARGFATRALFAQTAPPARFSRQNRKSKCFTEDRCLVSLQ